MSQNLVVKERATRPRSLRKKLRLEGKVPAILYGYEVEATPIYVDDAELSKIVRENGQNVVLTFELNGQKINALIGEAQFDTFSRHLKHIELISVDMSEETEVEAEIVLKGEAAGVKAGGEIAQSLYSLRVSATPDKLPEFVEIDVAPLAIGDSVLVKDLPDFADFRVMNDPEEHILSVQEKQDLPTEEVGEEAAEEVAPEVIGETEEDKEEPAE